MKYMLDTCVIAELQHPQGSALVKNAVTMLPEDSLYLSVITIGEIAKGITLLAEGAKKHSLTLWLTGLREQFSDRIVPIDANVAHYWGEITATLQQKGVVLSAADGLIGTTALINGMRLMTRNVKDFEPVGVSLINPWMVH